MELTDHYLISYYNMKTKEVNNSSDEGIDKYWSLNLKMLSLMGLRVSVKENEGMIENTLINKLPVLTANVLATCIATMQLTGVVCSIADGDKYMATQICSHFCASLVCISKGNRMAVTIRELQIVMRDLADLWRRHLPRENRQQVLTTAGSTSMFCKSFVTITVLVTLSFVISPFQNVLVEYKQEIVNYSYIYSQRPLILQYPFPIQTTNVYILVILEEEIMIVISGLFWVCCDTWFAQLTSHISIQIQILKYDLDVLINSESIDSRLKANFVTIIKRHNHLLRICKQVEKIFSPIILSTVLLAGINICLNVFELREMISIGNYADAAVHSFLLTNTFFQIVFYCVFAESLTQQTSSIAYAVYNSNWTGKNHVHKAYFQMLVIRSQSPFYCTGYGFFPIDHQRLTMVINTAFSYYMMLQTTDNK